METQITLEEMETLPWGQKLALLDHFNPDIRVACKVFNATEQELTVANEMRQKNVFTVDTSLDVTLFQPLFAQVTEQVASEENIVVNVPVQQVFSKPESASKPIKAKSEPKRRGRKGNKIKLALEAVPSTPTPADEFCAQHDVSLAVMCQANKRFIQPIDEQEPGFAAKVGTIMVKQDKVTKTVMIWSVK